MIDYSKFVEGSRNFLKNYIIDNRLESCVLGISGGIDSCISACLAKPVCDALNIPLIGRSLPCDTNKECETTTANLVGNVFCSDYKVVNLERQFQSVLHDLQLNEGDINKLQKGNVKARLRMIYLRNLASIHRGVVLDNDNFTEWNLGFWTVGGDSPMDVNLGLHYLWKTEIYELAEYLELECSCNRQDYCVSGIGDKDGDIKYDAIHASIKLIPTDGNGVSNSDCEQFGLDNYEQVDDVLKTMYYSNTTKEEYIRLIDSYNEQEVDKVMMLHQNTAYKRKELPIKPTKEELGL
jgi:NAD+ synthetase